VNRSHRKLAHRGSYIGRVWVCRRSRSGVFLQLTSLCCPNLRPRSRPGQPWPDWSVSQPRHIWIWDVTTFAKREALRRSRGRGWGTFVTASGELVSVYREELMAAEIGRRGCTRLGRSVYAHRAAIGQIVVLRSKGRAGDVDRLIALPPAKGRNRPRRPHACDPAELRRDHRGVSRSALMTRRLLMPRRPIRTRLRREPLQRDTVAAPATSPHPPSDRGQWPILDTGRR
jgi:hypothetical protein